MNSCFASKDSPSGHMTIEANQMIVEEQTNSALVGILDGQSTSGAFEGSCASTEVIDKFRLWMMVKRSRCSVNRQSNNPNGAKSGRLLSKENSCSSLATSIVPQVFAGSCFTVLDNQFLMNSNIIADVDCNPSCHSDSTRVSVTTTGTQMENAISGSSLRTSLVISRSSPQSKSLNGLGPVSVNLNNQRHDWLSHVEARSLLRQLPYMNIR